MARAVRARAAAAACVAVTLLACACAADVLVAAGSSPKFTQVVSESALQAPNADAADRDSPVSVVDATFHLDPQQFLVLRAEGPAGNRAQLRQLEDRAWYSGKDFGKRRAVSGEMQLVLEDAVEEVTFAQIRANSKSKPLLRLVYNKGRNDDKNGQAGDNRFYADHLWAVVQTAIDGDDSSDRWIRLVPHDPSRVFEFEVEVKNDRAQILVDGKGVQVDFPFWAGIKSHFVAGVLLSTAGKATARFQTLNYGY